MSQQPLAIDIRPAFNAYLAALTNARQLNQSLQEMQAGVQSYQQSLGQQWAGLNLVIKQGGTPQEVAYHLGHFLEDWAIQEALSLIVKLGQWVDPQDQNIQYEFWNKLELQYIWLQSQLWPSSATDEEEEEFADLFADLFANLEEEDDDLEEEGDRPAADHPTQELKPVRLLSQPSTTHPITSRQQNRQPVQPSFEREYFEMLRQAHDDSRESLQMAMEATRETRQAINGMVGPVTELLKSASQYAPYEAPAKPVYRAMRRITFVVILGLIVLALVAFVYFGLHFLY